MVFLYLANTIPLQGDLLLAVPFPNYYNFLDSTIVKCFQPVLPDNISCNNELLNLGFLPSQTKVSIIFCKFVTFAFVNSTVNDRNRNNSWGKIFVLIAAILPNQDIRRPLQPLSCLSILFIRGTQFTFTSVSFVSEVANFIPKYFTACFHRVPSNTCV